MGRLTWRLAAVALAGTALLGACPASGATSATTGGAMPADVFALGALVRHLSTGPPPAPLAGLVDAALADDPAPRPVPPATSGPRATAPAAAVPDATVRAQAARDLATWLRAQGR